MKAEYKRDLQNNYLILDVMDCMEEDGYETQMAEQNEIPGLLTMQSVKTNGQCLLYYEITSKQPLKDLFEKRFLRYSEIKVLLKGILEVIQILQKYLLSPIHLVFLPEYMYLNPAMDRLFLCYHPADHSSTIQKLSEFILKRLDHEDLQAVNLGYQFYQKTTEENFSLTIALQELLSEEAEEKKENEVRNVRHDESRSGYYERFPEIMSEKRRQNESVTDYLNENMNESADTEEAFQVEHRVRKKSQGKKSEQSWIRRGIDALFARVHPAIVFSMLIGTLTLEILFYMELIELTEAGGFFFLLIAVELLVYRSWKGIGKGKNASELWDLEEEEALYSRLQSQMYEQMGTDNPDDDIEETRCLVQERESDFVLVCQKGDRQGRFFADIIPSESGVLIGKAIDRVDVVIDIQTISRIHARVGLAGGQCYVQDMNSMNGTHVNGEVLQVQEQKMIKEGDVVSFAEIEYQVQKR